MPDNGTGHAPELVPIARVRRAHGVLGVMVVELLSPAAGAVLVAGHRVFAGTVRGDPVDPPKPLVVLMAEPFKDGMRVQFADVTDRETADTWRGRYLLLPADELPPMNDEELDPAELVGMSVVLSSGEVVGTVEAWYELRHDLLIEVSRPEGPVMIPFRPGFVESVDAEAGRIVVNPPDGLL